MVDSKRLEGKNIFVGNIFGENIFSKNIFTLPPMLIPCYPYLYTTPIPSYPLFEVEGGDKQTKDEQTHGPDGAMVVPFIVLDCIEWPLG